MTLTNVIIRSKVPSLFLELRLNQLYLLLAIMKTRKSMRDDDGFKREQKEGYVKHSKRNLMPGCTLLFYLDAPHGKTTVKYVSPVIRSGKVDIKGWSKSFGAMAMQRRTLN